MAQVGSGAGSNEQPSFLLRLASLSLLQHPWVSSTSISAGD